MSDGKAGRSLRMRFERAAKKAWELPTRPSNDKLLEMYALYKQAPEGDCERTPRGVPRDRSTHKACKGERGTTAAVTTAR